MKYILTAGWEDGVAKLTQRLARELAAGKQVLWLLSGGSNIQASIQVMDNISSGLSRNLSISLADERYGPPGHDQSNWHQLMQAGFDGKQAKLLPVLKPGRSFRATIEDYTRLIEAALAACDLAIA
jgi:6-phosphogluconolactonase/glucosamine-6-phosphate isomerase/deaminase